MAERAKTMTKASSMSIDHGSSEKRSSLFGAWRSRSSTRRDASDHHAAPQHAGLEGKELRDAVWKQQKQHESIAQAVVRPMRVIRYSPPRGSPSNSAEEEDGEEDDDDFSSAGSARGAGPQTVFEYDGVPTHDQYSSAVPRGNSKISRSLQRQRARDDDTRTSRLSMTFSRLSFSSSARSSLADYKAKKYDVEWKKDDDVPDCQVCHLAFTKWSRRRHHCRVCGDIICDDCSPDQVHVDGRFTRAKRACTACFGLLEAMMHLGDPHVSMVVEKEAGTREWVDKTPHKTTTKDTKRPQPTVYHDRLAEIQRVTAAGKKARRGAGSGVRQCVIKAQWLRAWLAFTRNHADNNTNNGSGTGDGSSDRHFEPVGRTRKDRTESMSSVLSSPASDGEAPGPIDNLSLLVMRKGCLVPRDGLVQIENQDFTGSGDQGRGDYQTIPLEVWDVLARYYGGGPRIEIVPSTIVGEPDRWVVDAAAVLRFGRAQKTNPHAAPASSSPAITVEEKVLERALMERHDPFSIFLDVPAMSNRAIYDPPHEPQQPQFASSTSALLTPSTPSSRPPTFQRSVSDSLTYTPSPLPAPRSGGSASGVVRGPSTPGVAARTKPEPSRSNHPPPPRQPRSNTERVPTTPKHPQQQPQQQRRTKPEPRQPTSNNQRDHEAHDTAASRPRTESGHRTATTGPTRRDAPPPSEPTAASAASAFALAMKEARLKQQRAIAGGGSGNGSGSGNGGGSGSGGRGNSRTASSSHRTARFE